MQRPDLTLLVFDFIVDSFASLASFALRLFFSFASFVSFAVKLFYELALVTGDGNTQGPFPNCFEKLPALLSKGWADPQRTPPLSGSGACGP